MTQTDTPPAPPVPGGYYARTAPVVQDWSNMVRFKPSLYATPRSMDELKAFLGSALQNAAPGSAIRVLGGLHSCSEICETDIVIDTTALPQTLEWAPDNSAVTATANWHLHDFLYELSRRGKSIAATGGTDAQTLAGLISTNTAPATPRHSVYETLEWVEYLAVGDDGRSVVERRATRGEPAFDAAVCSLGAIGILTRVHFGLIDQPFFSTIQKIVALDEVLADLDATSRRYDFWRVDWVPDTHRGLLWAATRIPPDGVDPDGDYPVDKSEGVLRFLMGVIEKLQDNGPFLSRTLEAVYEGMMLFYGEVKASGPLRNMLPVDRRAPLLVAMAEWSFDPADLRRVMDACRAYFSANRWPNLPIEIELTPTDRYLMSPWGWEELPYIVKFNFMYLTNFLSDAEKAEVVEHLRGLWEHLRGAGIRLRAHWGKLNFMDPEFVRSTFRFAEFAPYIQPRLVNPYLRERLGVAAASPPAGAAEVARVG